MDESLPLDFPEIMVRHEFWRRCDLTYKLDALQIKIRDEIYACNAKTICILASRQIGKSYCIVVLALEYCLLHPGSIVRIIAPTIKQASDIVADNLGPIAHDAPPGLVYRSKSEYRWRVGNSSLRLGSLERAHVDNNRGGNASLIIYEEPGFVHGDDFEYGVNSVLGPQLLRSNGREIYVSSPSEVPDHPLHDKILPKAELDGVAFRHTVYDSPSITPEQIAEAKRRSGGEFSDSWRREYLAEIIRSRNVVVVPDFDRTCHVGDHTLPACINLEVYIDWGGVRDKTVALLMGYDFLVGLDVVFDELVFDHNTATSAIVALLRESWYGQYNVTRTVADAAGQIRVDLIETHDFPVTMPVKEDWEANINNLANRFTSRKIKILPHLKILIQTCQSGTFNKHRTDFERTHALGHCDALAALMYGVRGLNRLSPYRPELVESDHLYMPRLNMGQMVIEPKRFVKDPHKKFGGFK